MNTKHFIIFILYLLVLYSLYIILKKQNDLFQTKSISYDDNILLRSNNITLQSLQTNKVNIKDLILSNGRILNKDTIKAFKNIPLKFKDKICLEDTCIDIPHINKLKRFFPYGSIIAYYDHDDIPEGWSLCDGSNNTPDLRSKFIIGGGRNYNIKETGGQDTITLGKKNIPEHSHDMFIPKQGTDTIPLGTHHKLLNDSIINEGIKGGKGFYIGPSNFSSPVDKESTLEYREYVIINRKGRGSWGPVTLQFSYIDKYGNPGVWTRHIKRMFRHHPRIIPINLIVKKYSFKYSPIPASSNLNIGFPPTKEVIENDERNPTQYNTLPAHYKVVYLMRNVKASSKPLEQINCHKIFDKEPTKEAKKQILIDQLNCMGQKPWI